MSTWFCKYALRQRAKRDGTVVEVCEADKAPLLYWPHFTEEIEAMTIEREHEIEAAVLRRLLQHLDNRKDVQNIELMNLAGFCRNCLAKWYVAAAAEHGENMDYEAARERIYGMPYEQWKAHYQREASAEQLAAFNAQAKSE